MDSRLRENDENGGFLAKIASWKKLQLTIYYLQLITDNHLNPIEPTI